MGCCLPSPTALGYPLVKALTVYTIQCGDAPSCLRKGAPGSAGRVALLHTVYARTL